MRTLHTPSIERVIDEDTLHGVSSFFPRCSGVVVFFAEDDRVVLISAASDLRAFVEDRLGATDAQASLGRRADLRPVTRKILAYPCGIGLETQLVCSRLAENLDAAIDDELFGRMTVWFLCFLESPMRWIPRDSGDLARSTMHEQGVIIGPIPRKEDATALGETLDDLFSLCRYPKELALAPNGTPCAYKEMGRCPGACDGSEALDEYRSRLLAAIDLIRSGLDRAKADCKRAIDEASSAMDFENAGAHKQMLDAISRLPAERYRGARSLAAMGLLVVSPSVRRGWAAIWRFGGTGLERICSASEDATDSELRAMLANAQDEHTQSGGVKEITRRLMQDLGFVSRELHAKPGRGRRRVSSVFDLGEEIRLSELRRAIAHASSPNEQDSKSAGS